ncbi:MAG: sigma-70 family RNA polymerase sigma factor [bacterium]|nr:sigma-70 family RNA polymerase sigma factor [bacterium]
MEHLFRNQSALLTATLTARFGLGRIDLVEDVVQETLLRALKTWPNHGIPENPAAWLYRAAHNLAIDQIRRETAMTRKEEEIVRYLESDGRHEAVDPSFESEISDAQLRMLFACCHPSLAADTQTAIALKELCGFSVNEIARAFLVEDATIAQRIVRGKRQLRSGVIPFEIPEPSELAKRRESILRIIYLIFNEGYARHSGEALLSDDIAREAIRLAELLANHRTTNHPDLHALLALFYFQISRFPSRMSPDGELVLLEDQDRTKWDHEAIARGFQHLELAAKASTLSRYHLEAGIASLHAIAQSFEQTDWRQMIELYDQLVEIDNSPVVRLNRAVALGCWKGPEVGMAALDQSTDKEALQGYHYYHAVRAEFLIQLGRTAEAAACLNLAISLAGNETERLFLSRKLTSLNKA